jgi:hypothetical protein
MQFSSFVHAASLAVSLASVLVGASVAFADVPSSASQQTTSQQAMMPAGGATQAAAPSNTGPYDSPDFVVPESQIFS